MKTRVHKVIAKGRWVRYGFWRMTGRRRSVKNECWRFASSISEVGSQSYDIHFPPSLYYSAESFRRFRRHNVRIAGLSAGMSPLSDARQSAYYDQVLDSRVPGGKKCVAWELDNSPANPILSAIRETIRKHFDGGLDE